MADFQSFFVNRSRALFRWEAEIEHDVNGESELDVDWGFSVLPVTEDDYRAHVLPSGWSLCHFSREIIIDEVEYTAAAYAQALETVLHITWLGDANEEGHYRAGDYWMPTEINETSRQGLLAVLRGAIKGDMERIAFEAISPDTYGDTFIRERGYTVVESGEELVIA